MKVRAVISIATAVLFTLAVAVSLVSAAPQGPWVQPPVDLSAAGQSAAEPQITVGPDGSATTIWRRYDGSKDIIEAATRSNGGSFGAPVDLSANGQNAGAPQITTAPDGTTTAIWSRNNGSKDIIQAATRPPGGSFGTPVDLSAAGQSAFFPQVTTAPDGTTTAIWTRSSGVNDIIQTTTRPPGGTFGAPVNLSTAGRDASNARITTAPDGTTTAIWYRSDGSNNIAQSATRSPGGTFGLPVDLSTIGRNAYEPQITTAPDGTTTVVWDSFDGTHNIVQSVTRPPGGTFGSPVDLSAVGGSAYGPQVATAPDGTTTVVWYRFNLVKNIVQSATRPPGGTFGAPVDLSVAGQSAYDPQITTAPDGTATAVWHRINGANSIVQSATRLPGGSFGAPVDLSATGQNASSPQITTASDGTATAIWTRFDSSNYIVQSISTARPTPLLTVSKSGSGVGTIASTPLGIECGADCVENYVSYTTVTLVATPAFGNTFKGWGGACKSSTGNTCQVTLLADQSVTAGFEPVGQPPSTGKAKLRIIKIKPRKPTVKRGKKVMLKVRVKNKGNATARNARLCLKIAKGVKKRLRPAGKSCRKVRSLASGRAMTRTLKLKATRRTRRGKKYKVAFKFSAKGAKTVTRSIKVRVR